MYALDGRTDSLLWEVQLDRMEVNASPAVGYFNSDSVVDFFPTVEPVTLTYRPRGQGLLDLPVGSHPSLPTTAWASPSFYYAERFGEPVYGFNPYGTGDQADLGPARALAVSRFYR